MKKLILVLALMAPLLARADFRIYRTLILTNAGNLTNGIQFTASGDTRTGTNGTPLNVQFSLTNRVDYQRTNIAQMLGLNPVSGLTAIYGDGTNSITFVGGTNINYALSVFGAWASVSNYTSTIYSAAAYITPYTVQSNSFREWQQNIVVSNLAYATATFGAAYAAFTNFLGAHPGVQAFTNKEFYGGTLGSASAGVKVGLLTFSNRAFFVYANTTQSMENVTIDADGYAYKFSGPSGETSNTVARLADITNRVYQFGSQFSINTGTTPRTVDLTNDLTLDTLRIPSGDLYTPAIGSVDETEFYATFSLAEGKTSQNILRVGDLYSDQFYFDGTNVFLKIGFKGTNGFIHGPTFTGFSTNSGTNFGGRLVNAILEASSGWMTNLTAYAGALSNLTASLLEASLGKAIATNLVCTGQSGPWAFDEGAYSSLTGGGSNNVVQLSTNAWTRLSGNVGAANINSLRTGDGLPMSGPNGTGGRRVGIVNGSTSALTLIDQASDGFETLATNRMDMGGVNVTLGPRERAEFVYNSSSTLWELLYPKPPTNLVVSTTADFSGANTTNVFDFTSAQFRRMTNALTTNTTIIVSNLVAGARLEIFLIGANGGTIASNYTFKVRTNNLPSAIAIHWVTSTNGRYDVAVSSNKFGRITLTAPFTTNIFARYEEGN